MNIKTAIEKHENNTLNSLDVFVDWFCKDSELKTKTKKMMSLVVELSKFWSDDFKENTLEINNNSTSQGILYDSIEIVDNEGYIMFKIVPSKENVSQLMKFVSKDANLEYLTVTNWKDIKDYFKNNKV